MLFVYKVETKSLFTVLPQQSQPHGATVTATDNLGHVK